MLNFIYKAVSEDSMLITPRSMYPQIIQKNEIKTRECKNGESGERVLIAAYDLQRLERGM